MQRSTRNRSLRNTNHPLMKSYLALIAMCLSFSAVAQKEVELVQITREGLAQTATVQFRSNEQVLQIDSLLIPCSKNSVPKWKKENNSHYVEFFLQRNTAIRNTNDANYRRAWVALPFHSRDAAKKFIVAFQKVSYNHR